MCAQCALHINIHYRCNIENSDCAALEIKLRYNGGCFRSGGGLLSLTKTGRGGTWGRPHVDIRQRVFVLSSKKGL